MWHHLGFMGGCSWHWVHLIVGRDAETFARIIGKDPLCHQNVQLHIYVGKKTGKSRTSRSRCKKNKEIWEIFEQMFSRDIIVHYCHVPCHQGEMGCKMCTFVIQAQPIFLSLLQKSYFFVTWCNRQWKDFASRTLTLLFGKHWKSAFRPQASSWPYFVFLGVFFSSIWLQIWGAMTNFTNLSIMLTILAGLSEKIYNIFPDLFMKNTKSTKAAQKIIFYSHDCIVASVENIWGIRGLSIITGALMGYAADSVITCQGVSSEYFIH